MTTSATVRVGNYTYVFLNEEDTSTLTFIRFVSKTSTPQTGLVGGTLGGVTGPVQVQAGPIAVIPYPESNPDQLRLYAIGDKLLILELVLTNAGDDSTDPSTAWTGGDLSYGAAALDNTYRKVSGDTYLSAGYIQDGPAVFFKGTSKPKPGTVKINYCYDNGNKWEAGNVSCANTGGN